MGRKKLPHYRVVVTDRQAPREGRFVETLGHYKPLVNPARLVLDLERVDYWISQGAVPSQTVSSLIHRARKGGDEGLALGDVSVDEERARKAEALAAKRKAEAERIAAAAAAAPRAEAAAVETVEEGGEGEGRVAAEGAAEIEGEAEGEGSEEDAADAGPEDEKE
jgi:small subunit ribosomal protein S16